MFFEAYIHYLKNNHQIQSCCIVCLSIYQNILLKMKKKLSLYEYSNFTDE